MTIGIDTSRIHSETYKEYSKHEHTCASYQDFLLVEIIRLKLLVSDLLNEMADIEDMEADAILLGGY